MTAPSFWGRLFGGLFGTKRLDKDSKAESHRGSSTASGNPVTPETALKLAAVWACVRLRSQTIASLPLHLYNEDKTIAKDHYLYRILHDSPNADMTASEFWEAMAAALDLWGNAYAHIVRSSRNGQVISLEVLNPEQVTTYRSKDGIVTYLYREGRTVYNYADADVFHLKGFTLDGFIGLSSIQYQASGMGFQIDANTAANQEFKNGLKAGGFLKTGEGKLNDPQRERLRANLEEFGKPENAGKFMVLEAGMEVVSTGNVRISPQDAQLLQSRYFGIEEICRTFATPPQMIYHTDKASSWASSLEGMKLGYLQFSLRPNLVRIEQQIVKKLLTPAERLKFKPKFSVEGLLRADSQGRATFYTSALQNGWMSRNEVRELEELPPVEGADSLTVQLNLTPIEMLQAVANQKTGQTNGNQN